MAKRDVEKELEPPVETTKRRKIVKAQKPVDGDQERFAVTLDRDLVNKIDIARRDLRMDRCEFATHVFLEATKRYRIQRMKEDEIADPSQENAAA